jgi:hypothetical protein
MRARCRNLAETLFPTLALDREGEREDADKLWRASSNNAHHQPAIHMHIWDSDVVIYRTARFRNLLRTGQCSHHSRRLIGFLPLQSQNWVRPYQGMRSVVRQVTQLSFSFRYADCAILSCNFLSRKRAGHACRHLAHCHQSACSALEITAVDPQGKLTGTWDAVKNERSFTNSLNLGPRPIFM